MSLYSLMRISSELVQARSQREIILHDHGKIYHPHPPSLTPSDDDELVAIPRLAERTGVTPQCSDTGRSSA